MRFRGKKRNKKRLLATFVTSIHFQIKGSLLTLTKDSANVDNDVILSKAAGILYMSRQDVTIKYEVTCEHKMILAVFNINSKSRIVVSCS